MYDVCDVCRYVINYSNKKEYSISNLKLQKLLYFIQAVFIIDKGKQCFNDQIEAWDFGPVVPKAYREFKMYGCADIPPITSYFIFDEDDIWNTRRVEFDESIIKRKDRKAINKVVDMFSEYTATDLVQLTINQLPWENVYEPGMNNVITPDMLKEYYSR